MVVLLLLAAQGFDMSHGSFPSGFIDEAGELSYQEAAAELKTKYVATTNEAALTKNIQTDFMNPVAWKQLFDVVITQNGGPSKWSKLVVARSEKNLSYRSEFRTIIQPYLRRIFSASRKDGLLKGSDLENYKNFVQYTTGSNWNLSSNKVEAFLQLSTMSVSAPGNERRLSAVYVRNYPQSYFTHYSYANSFRSGDASDRAGSVQVDVMKFRQLSREMTMKFPNQPTPWFTVAVTAKDSATGLPFARKYLALEKRSIKKGWVSIIKKKYAQL